MSNTSLLNNMCPAASEAGLGTTIALLEGRVASLKVATDISAMSAESAVTALSSDVGDIITKLQTAGLMAESAVSA